MINSKFKLIREKILKVIINLKKNKTKKITLPDYIKIFNKNLRSVIIALFIILIILIPCGRLFINSIFFTLKPPMIIFDSLVRVIKSQFFQKCLLNSLIISISTTAISIVIGLFASYALSRIRSRWVKPYELFLYILQMFPGIVFMVPYFIIFVLIKRYFFIQMQNTYHGIILTYISFALPFCILMLKNFINAIPREIDEQAQIDGCNRFDVIYKIILPLSLPGILAVAVFSFIISWNEILFAFSLTNNDTMTASVYIIKKLYFGSHQGWMDWHTASIFVTLPIAIIFAFLQKKMISGLSSNFLN